MFHTSLTNNVLTCCIYLSRFYESLTASQYCSWNIASNHLCRNIAAIYLAASHLAPPVKRLRLPACLLTLPFPLSYFGGRLDCRGDKLLAAWRNFAAMNHAT